MSASLPEWLLETTEVFNHPQALIALSLCSVGLFVGGLLGIPWFVGRLPADYLRRSPKEAHGIDPALHPLARGVLRVARNALGTLLFMLGVLMLFLPGQGVLTMLVALFLLDFPGKRRLIRKVMQNPVIFRSLNRIRKRAGKPPLSSAKPLPLRRRE